MIGTILLLATVLCCSSKAKEVHLVVEIDEELRDFLKSTDVVNEEDERVEVADGKIGSSRSSSSSSIGVSEGSWSNWSPWTTCSRMCDGGVTLSLRTCNRVVGSDKKKKKKKVSTGDGKSSSSSSLSPPPRCPGDFIRRRICNMHPCSKPTDFRSAQCSAYNTKPYRGKLYIWLPFYDPEDPCTLTCQAEGYNFVAKLSTKVQDGTRCRDGALDMCVQGQCKPVGCDLEVGSTLKVDECGVCGGDGSACASAPIFVWSPRPFDTCPVTCGGGFQISEPACLQKDTKQEVDQRLCDISLRPRTQTRPCNQFQCPIVWKPGEWGQCSASCGPGVQTREFQCVQGGINGTEMLVKTGFCPRHKPPSEKSCNVAECPRWFQGIWSECSVTCGVGIQRRAVVCRNDKGQYSENCGPHNKPEVQQECHTGLPCPTGAPITEPPPCVPETTLEPETTQRPITSTTETSSTIATTPPTTSPRPREYHTTRVTFETPDIFIPLAVTPGTKPVESTAATTVRKEPYTPRTAVTTERTIDPDTVRTKVYRGAYYVGEWNLCSASCGPGHRRRLIQCRLKLDLPTDAIAILPDSECEGARPMDVERCSVWCVPTSEPPSMSSTIPRLFTKDLIAGATRSPEEDLQEVTSSLSETVPMTTALSLATTSSTPRPIVWKVVGEILAPCTIMCPPGFQRVMCLQQSDGSKIPVGAHCDKSSISPGSCLNGSCISLPRWRVEGFSECSVSCGGGWRMRAVRCVQQMTVDPGQEVEVDPKLCPQPPPKQQDLCNMVDCPPRWKAEPWSKCSRTCGGGFQTRKLRCEMTLAHPTEKTVQLSPSKCFKTRPKASQPCNRQSCPFSLPKFVMPVTTSTTTPASTTEQSSSDASDHGLAAVRNMTSRRVTTKASGTVSVYKGSMIKVHCPNEHWSAGTNHSTGVLWFKGRRRIATERRGKSTRMSVSARGALRIRKVNFGDSATYTCLAGPIRSDMKLVVQQLPPSGFPSEDDPNHHPSTNSPPPYKEEEEEEDDSDEMRRDPHLRMRHYQINPGHFRLRPSSTASPLVSDDSGHVSGISGFHLQWKVGSWSPCSHTCGKDALQIREIQCVVNMTSGSHHQHREMKPVSGAMCATHQLPRPQTSRACTSNPSCPRWVAGQWSECTANNCMAWNTAYQKREVYCESDNIRCDEETRPRRKRECFQPKCKSLWKTGPWSECTATCGDKGIRTRKVECVWFGSGLSAGVGACKDEHPPEIVSQCQGPPCADDSDCVNQSSYCEVVRVTNLCRMSQFRLQCCASCTQDGEVLSPMN